MRREFMMNLPKFLPAAMFAATTLCAAPNVSVPAGQYLNQINEQASQIEAQADGLERYVRSGAHDAVSSAMYTVQMADSEDKLAALLDQVATKPGATNDTRIQMERIKSVNAELKAFTNSTLYDLETKTPALLQSDVLANISNIEQRCNSIRSAAEALLVTK